MQLLIEELKHTASSLDSKQNKTIETLNAISVMLESLKVNQILKSPEKKDKD